MNNLELFEKDPREWVRQQKRKYSEKAHDLRAEHGRKRTQIVREYIDKIDDADMWLTDSLDGALEDLEFVLQKAKSKLLRNTDLSEDEIASILRSYNGD
jgi:hypothetical protein